MVLEMQLKESPISPKAAPPSAKKDEIEKILQENQKLMKEQIEAA